MSTGIPVLTVNLGIILAYGFAGGLQQPGHGSLWYRYCRRSSHRSALGLTLATGAYGPIAGSAGGNAEMSHMGPDVTLTLSIHLATPQPLPLSCIGSAALTAMALLITSKNSIGLLRVAKFSESQLDQYIFCRSRRAVPIMKTPWPTS